MRLPQDAGTFPASWCFGQRRLTLLLAEAVATIDWTAFRWLEGNLRGLIAARTRRIEHLAGRAPTKSSAAAASPCTGARTITAHFLKAVAAVHRAITRWLERHLRWLAAFRTRGVKHLTPHCILVH